MAPGLSWANNSADSGDLISAVATGGIAHPSGYPTYLLLARLFQFLPWGSIAFRTNLFSVVSTVLAAVIMYFMVIKIPYGPIQNNKFAGLISAYAFGLSPLVWSQAVITEVYGLHTLFVVLILYLMLLGIGSSLGLQLHLDRLRGLVFGLGMGNHLTTIFLLPVIFINGIVTKSDVENADLESRHKNIRLIVCLGQKWRLNLGALTVRMKWLAIGLLVYLILPLRASFHPPINWGNPVTFKNFYWLVSGQLYGERVFTVPTELILPRIEAWANLLISQFGLLGLAIGLYGLFYCRPIPIKFYLVTGWLFIAFSLFSIGYNSYDSEVYLTYAFLPLVIWIGLGAADIIQSLSLRTPWLGTAVGILIIGYIIGHALFNFPKVDASRDQRAEIFGQKVLAVAPSNALIFTTKDQDSFTLWYFQFVLNERPDIAILVEGLLPYQWYRDMLRYTYSSLVIPDQTNGLWLYTIIEANASRPICKTSLEGSEVLLCR
ncbi:MAG: DUF2723 domain-containing protein [Proteobacteria bacterium]|nr:DUF2723 domain-containing protein [Pseudomonadota bacterium]